MKRILMLTACVLAMMAWAVAQQSGSKPADSGQAAPPSSAGAAQSQSTAPDAPSAAGQSGAPSQGQASNAPITEGCLGGSSSNFTITDKAGKTYKLNIPADADASPLASHVGESILVLGTVKDAGGSPSIDVEKVGRGSGTCPGSTSTAPPSH
jgi:hypothetical protein